jgi:hypothetical protein|tara:strand:- start:944 stop:1534 length:591 start_codon:yes stop_codon:yes gene_type:complete
MLTAKLDDVTSVDEFYNEIRSQQEAFHGAHYCAMHDAMRKYMKDCNSYKELGTHQGGSAAAVMSGEHKPKYMELIDIDHVKYRAKLKSLAEPYCKEHGIELVVREADSGGLGSMSAKAVDMLMIDSIHKRYHMEKELQIHGQMVTKYIVAHDTSIAQSSNLIELYECLRDFCIDNPSWSILERGVENVGYTVLKRK